MQVPSDPIPRIIEASGNRPEGQVCDNMVNSSRTRSPNICSCERRAWVSCRSPKSLRWHQKNFFPLNESTSVLDGRLIRGPAKELAENVNRALSGYSEIAEKARELTRKENGRTGKPVLWLLAGAA